MEEVSNARKRSIWKVLAVVVSVVVVTAAVAAVAVLLLRGGDSGTSEEEMVQQYEEIKQEADAAVKEMEALTSAEAQSDAEVYEPSVNEVVQTMEALESSVEQATEDVSAAAEETSEVAQEYEQLLVEIEAYYTYLEGLTTQAVAQLESLKSLVPSLTGELDSVVQQARAQFSERFNAALNSLSSGLSSASQKVDAAIPED